MLDILDRTGFVLRGDRKSLANIVRQESHAGSSGARLKKGPAARGGSRHVFSPARSGGTS
ncbi:hypothetical protein GSP01_19280 [Gluconobacter sphaericus NBRC 12467]|nr:hypothetical protein GSP01_19280 [Gluconobacter sphaericus NBRC 12467]